MGGLLKKDLAIIVPFLGRMSDAESYLLHILREMESARSEIEFVLVFDGPKWLTLPSIQKSKFLSINAKFVFLDAASSMPALLYNRGLQSASSRFVQFYNPDMGWRYKVNATLCEAAMAAKDDEVLYVANWAGVANEIFPHEATPSILYEWMIYEEVVPLSNFAVPRNLAERIGGFDCSALLQRYAGWDFLLRLTRAADCKLVGVNEEPAKRRGYGLRTSQLHRTVPFSESLSRRYMMRSRSHVDKIGTAVEYGIDQKFQNDLPEKEASYVSRQMARFGKGISFPKAQKTKNRPLRITITGGAWEYHHNRLCFFSYLEKLEGTGFGTYQVLFDKTVEKRDLIDSDLIIISRGRSDNIANILRYAKELSIPTIYMIDDNWLQVGKDWPKQYGQMFSPGAPDYDNFVHAISNVDAVLTYNQFLAEDVKPFAKQILMLPNSVDLAYFESFPRPAAKEHFIVGYAGSPRYATAAFDALIEVGKRPDVKILLMGQVDSELEKKFNGENLIRLEHRNYDNYVKKLREVGVDILLAPLDDSRTSKSKCPNKYLEITAVGAVGIYSRLEPYIWYVDDDDNGKIVTDSLNVAEWVDAINKLLDQKKISAMSRSARSKIVAKYDVPIVAEQFRTMITELVSNYRKNMFRADW